VFFKSGKEMIEKGKPGIPAKKTPDKAKSRQELLNIIS
jgi:hypothetical protein